MSKVWKLYVHTNRMNGKRYVGITSRKNVNDRWVNGRGYKTQVFGKAIEKYGWDSFKHEVIATGTEEEIKELEQEYIKKWKTNDRKYGYNVAKGGDGGMRVGSIVYQYDLSGKEVKVYNSISESVNYGFTATSVRGCCVGETKFYNGYIFTYERMFKEDLLEYLCYEKHQYRKVYCYDIKTENWLEYEHLEDVEEDGYNLISVLGCCYGAIDLYDNCLWSFKKLPEEQISKRIQRGRKIDFIKKEDYFFINDDGSIEEYENIFGLTSLMV